MINSRNTNSRLRLSGLLVLIIAGVMTIFSAIRVHRDQQEVEKRLETNAQMVASRVSREVRPTIWEITKKSKKRRYSSDLARHVLDAELESPMVQAVYVYGNFGHLYMGKYKTAQGDIKNYELSKPNPMPFGHKRVFRHSILQGKMTIGAVEVVLDTKHLEAVQSRLFWVEVLQTFVVAFLCATFLYFSINRVLLEPMRQLVELQASNQVLRNYLSNIIDSMPSLLIGVDLNGNVTQWNREAERNTGLSRIQTTGKPLATALPRLAEKLSQIQQAVEDKQVRTDTQSYTDKNGNTFYEYITIYPLISTGVNGAVIRIDDVTEKHQLQEQLTQSQKMDAIGQLAGGVAHDFNNMLGGILGCAELLSPWVEEQEKPKKYLGIIMTAAERAAALADKLLAFGRKQLKDASTLDVHEVIYDSIAILENTIDKRVNIQKAFTETVAYVIGDPAQLQNIFLNLGINASHAMPNGGTLSFRSAILELDQTYCDESAFDLTPGRFVEIEVCDTGSGISNENLPKIFEPFFTTKEQGKGTGLGLAASYGIVQQHNGSITVQSELGKGTCFVVLLPLSETKPTTPSKPRETHSGTGLILVVDDEPIMRSMAKACLNSIGYDVMLAQNGEEAVSFYRDQGAKIDLVICDMIMPKMNGSDCFKALRVINPDIRFVLASGFTRDEDTAEMKRQGLAGFIQKPYRSAQLARVTSEALNRESVST